MGLFSRFFSKPNDIAALRKAMTQQRYADALLILEELDQTELTTDECNEIQTLATTAGDTLAQVNLDEGLFLLRDDQRQRAVDHLQLAQQQAVSPQLQGRINETLNQLDSAEPITVAAASDCGSCSSCGPQVEGSPAPLDEADHPDFASQLDLILVSYPEALAERYQDKSVAFQQAFLLAHQGDEVAALKQFKQISDDERDDLYDFEVGSILGRQGSVVKACAALQSALKKNPSLLLAAETLVMLLMAQAKHNEAIVLIQQMLAQDQEPAFCHAQLASIYHLQQKNDLALEHGRKAISSGQTDPRIVLMTAMLLEGKGEIEEAEMLYSQLPSGGGCSGGINLYLAEFLLRQRRELRKLIDVFNGACRNEPDNPRWQLRVAQTYLARGWDKQGLSLLKTVVTDSRLTEDLLQEGKTLLAQYSTSS
ncbi:MAG: hypothetical protein BA874_06255 [Desulfuromonadales bacterium C00003068]|nr:MAG: hypothetical protein BA874_06255 [Desulfuromonadales bacterium C00003068]